MSTSNFQWRHDGLKTLDNIESIKIVSPSLQGYDSFLEKSPIIGYGIIDSNEFVRASGIPGGTHAHNYILNILIMGGTICLIEHIYMYINIVKHILKNKGF